MTAHGRTTATSAAVVPTAPQAPTLPAVAGDVRGSGATLTCASGDWDDDYAYTFEWLRDGAVVAARAPTLTVVTRPTSRTSCAAACRPRA